MAWTPSFPSTRHLALGLLILTACTTPNTYVDSTDGTSNNGTSNNGTTNNGTTNNGTTNNGTDPTCSGACAGGELRCTPGGDVEACLRDGEGCLSWQLTMDCQAPARGCEDTGGVARCVDLCDDTCQEGSPPVCDASGAVETCEVGADGCFHPVTTACPEGDVCDGARGEAACVLDCSGACELGSTRCDADGDVERCEAPTQGCPAWSIAQTCGERQRCDDAGPDTACVCNDVCALDSSTCQGTTLQTCAADADGCTTLRDITDCQGEGRACVIDADAASCATLLLGDTCEAAFALDADGTISGDDFGRDFTNALDLSDPSCAPSTASAELVLALPGDGRQVRVTKTGGADVAFRALGAACASSTSCTAAAEDDLLGVLVTLDQPRFVVVEGAPGAMGATDYAVHVDFSEDEVCDNGVDDDLDDQTDCRDADCAGLGACPAFTGFGDCANLEAEAACLPDEVCRTTDGIFPPLRVCAVQGCDRAEDCPPPPSGGDATPQCQDLNDDRVLECALGCADGRQCPDGMACSPNAVCVWQGPCAERTWQGDHVGPLDDLAGVTTITGNLTIRAVPGLTSLSALTCLHTVGGELTIASQHALTHLDELAALTELGGGLVVTTNDALQNVDGLAGLTAVPGQTYIRGNNALQNLEGLSALTTVGGELFVGACPALTSLGLRSLVSVDGRLAIGSLPLLADTDDLAALTAVGGNLEVVNNDTLASLDGLSALRTVGGNLWIYGNPMVARLDGLNAVTAVGGDLRINSDDGLTELGGFGALTSVGGSLVLSSNPRLVGVRGLNALVSVGQHVTIHANAALLDLNGLTSLTEIGGELQVNNNAALRHLDGLAALHTVASHLYVSANGGLISVDGLGSLTYTGGRVAIFNNPQLCLDDVSELIDLLNAQVVPPPVAVDISGNTGPCEDNCVVPHPIEPGAPRRGITAGAERLRGPCVRYSASPDETWRLSPDQDATVCVSTEGTLWNTLLYARSDSCYSPPELACNDDAAMGVAWSQIELDVTAGIDYFITVDGIDGAAGSYAITVSLGPCPPL